MNESKETSDSPPQEETMAKETFTIEELASKHNVPRHFAQGLKAREGWPMQKRLTESEYLARLQAFVHGPTVVRKKGGE